MEEELKLQFVKFNSKADKGRLFTRLAGLRNKMVADLDALMANCV
jgi:hypothetical protein